MEDHPYGAVMNRFKTILLAVAAVSVACGPARRGEPLMGAYRLDAEEERGRMVFMENCQSCHPGGEAGLGPALNDKALPEFLKRFQVRNGLGSMPSFSKREIPDRELDDLMTYLAALRDRDPAPE